MKYIFYLAALAAGAIATAVIAPKADAAGGDLYETDFTTGIIFKFSPAGQGQPLPPD